MKYTHDIMTPTPASLSINEPPEMPPFESEPVAGPNWTRTKLDFFITIIWGYLLVHLVVGTKFTYVYPCKSI